MWAHSRYPPLRSLRTLAHPTPPPTPPPTLPPTPPATPPPTRQSLQQPVRIVVVVSRAARAGETPGRHCWPLSRWSGFSCDGGDRPTVRPSVEPLGPQLVAEGTDLA